MPYGAALEGAVETGAEGPDAELTVQLKGQTHTVSVRGGQFLLGAMLDAGLAATVNSDDPAYFGGYMNENFTQVFAATGLTAKHAYQLAFNSFEASFASNADKRVWEHKLKETFERCVEHDY